MKHVKIDTPSDGRVTINAGNFTQLIGQNYQLIQDVSGVIIDYVTRKKYLESELVLFQQQTPSITYQDQEIVIKGQRIIQIESVSDVDKELQVAKKSLMGQIVKQSIRDLEVNQLLAKVNDTLIQLESYLNQSEYTQFMQDEYQSKYQQSLLIDEITLDEIVAKRVHFLMEWQQEEISLRYMSLFAKLKMLIAAIEKLQVDTEEPCFIILNGLDKFLSQKDYLELCSTLHQLSIEYPAIKVLTISTTRGYAYCDARVIEMVNCLNESIIAVESVEFMYQRLVENYPTNCRMTIEEFTESLSYILYDLGQKHSDYHYSDQDRLILNLLAKLYHYPIKIRKDYQELSQLEKNYLQSI